MTIAVTSIAKLAVAQAQPTWATSSVEAAPNETLVCRPGLLSPYYSSDANQDGVFTYSDLTAIIADIFRFPGDVFKSWAYGSDFGNFFEMTCTEASGVGALLSAMLVVGMVISSWNWMVDVLRGRV
jgi:hypothetical protein